MSEFIDNALHRGQICSSLLTDRGKCINTFHLRYLEQTTEERLLDLRTLFNMNGVQNTMKWIFVISKSQKQKSTL